MDLKLVPIQEKYVDELVSIINDKRLRDFLNSNHPEKITREYISEKIQKDIENWESGEAYKFVALAGDKVVGQISLYNPQEDGSYEVGYFVGSEFWGRGIATEMVKSICKFGESRGIKKVFAEIEKRNPASIRVLEKAGFKKVRDLEKEVRMENEII